MLRKLRDALERAGAGWTALPQRVRTVVVVVAVLALATLATYPRARAQQPQVFPDSIVYLEIARQPLAIEHLFYPKPFTVPAIYRVIGANESTIMYFQIALAVIAWSALGLAIAHVARRRRTRVVAVLAAVLLLVEPLRIGWTAAILSESIADSLMALAIAAAILLASKRGRRSIIVTALVVVVIAWVGTRDSNAITLLAAVILGVLAWRLPWRLAKERWAAVLCGGGIILSAGALWTACHAPAEVTGVTAMRISPPEMLSRSAMPAVNVTLLRVFPHHDARSFFIDRGLPQVEELATYAPSWDGSRADFFTRTDLTPARRWIVAHGSATYAHWILLHPFARTAELAHHIWDVLAPRQQLRGYMPKGWRHGWLHGLSGNHKLLVLLMLVAPIALWRTRRHPLSVLAAVLIGSGVVGAAAAYYGDAFEPVRHCYGAGQQIVFGLVLAVLAWLDGQPELPASEPPNE